MAWLKDMLKLPGANLKEKYTKIPLTTIINNPKVIKINGKDSVTSMGLMYEFAQENIKPAVKNAMVPEVGSTLSYPVPSKRIAIQIPKEFSNHLIAKDENCFCILYYIIP